MLDPIIRKVDEEVADRMLAMRTYLSNANVSDDEATQLTAAAFTGSAVPFFIAEDGKLTTEYPDEDEPG